MRAKLRFPPAHPSSLSDTWTRALTGAVQRGLLKLELPQHTWTVANKELEAILIGWIRALHDGRLRTSDERIIAFVALCSGLLSVSERGTENIFFFFKVKCEALLLHISKL